MKVLVLLGLLALALGLVPLQNVDDPTCVKGEWIVTYKTNTSLDDATRHWAIMEAAGADVRHKYDMGDMFRGFAGAFSDEFVAHLQNDPLVATIYCDCLAFAYQTCDRDLPVSTWGLSRISHGPSLAGLPGNYQYESVSNGGGVQVYVCDTGVRTTHEDFGTRAKFGVSFTGESSNADGNGHGTHCAGTVAGAMHGVARSAGIIAVKVLNNAGSGQYSWIISGINWVLSDGSAVNNQKIISMSLGGTGGESMQPAVDAAFRAGIMVVVAAGNSNANACNYTPAKFPNCFTVGSTDRGTSGGTQVDIRSSFSNIGTCVDIFAPGSLITSAWYTSDTATNTISGTSMACPHVAGYAAVLRSQHRSLTPDEIQALILEDSHTGSIQNVGTGSPNKLLYNGC